MHSTRRALVSLVGVAILALILVLSTRLWDHSNSASQDRAVGHPIGQDIGNGGAADAKAGEQGGGDEPQLALQYRQLHDLWLKYRTVRSINEIPDHSPAMHRGKGAELALLLAREQHWPELLILLGSIDAADRRACCRNLLEELSPRVEQLDNVLAALVLLSSISDKLQPSLRQAFACIAAFGLDRDFAALLLRPCDGSVPEEEAVYAMEPGVQRVLGLLRASSAADETLLEIHEVVARSLRFGLPFRLLSETFDFPIRIGAAPPLSELLANPDQVSANALAFLVSNLQGELPPLSHEKVVKRLVGIQSPLGRRAMAQLWLHQLSSDYRDLSAIAGADILDSGEFREEFAQQLRSDPWNENWPQIARDLTPDRLDSLAQMTLNLLPSQVDDCEKTVAVIARLVGIVGVLSEVDPDQAKCLARRLTSIQGWETARLTLTTAPRFGRLADKSFERGLSLLAR